MRGLFLIVAALVAFVFLSSEDSVTGAAIVVDGDSFEFGDQGIDAPEGRQTCRDANGAEYRCGQRSVLALYELLEAQSVRCRRIDRDRYNRTVLRCFIGSQDVGEWMVLNGHALAYRAFSHDYVDEENVARTMKRGVWQGTFVPLWSGGHNSSVASVCAARQWPSRRETIASASPKGSQSQKVHYSSGLWGVVIRGVTKIRSSPAAWAGVREPIRGDIVSIAVKAAKAFHLNIDRSVPVLSEGGRWEPIVQ